MRSLASDPSRTAPFVTHSVRIHRFGGPEVLSFDTVRLPPLRPGEARVRVEASGVNPVDFKIREGQSELVADNSLPYALGRDFAGIVEAVKGDGVGLHAGDAVFGMLGIDRGAYADHVIVKAGEACLRPHRLRPEQAAAVPVAALTAWQGLFDQGRLKAGQTVLIHAASGGVGHFAVQFARACGARVIATANGSGCALARELGADLVIDYSPDDPDAFDRVIDASRTALAQWRHGDVDAAQSLRPSIGNGEVDGVDLVLDLVGGETQQRSWDILRDGGSLISTVQEPCEEESLRRQIRVACFTAHPSCQQLGTIATMIDAGTVDVIVQGTYRMTQAQEAHAILARGLVHGKLVLTPVDPHA